MIIKSKIDDFKLGNDLTWTIFKTLDCVCSKVNSCFGITDSCIFQEFSHVQSFIASVFVDIQNERNNGKQFITDNMTRLVKKCSDTVRESLNSLKSCEHFAEGPKGVQVSKKKKKALKRKGKTSTGPKIKIAKFSKPREYPPLVHGSNAEPCDDNNNKSIGETDEEPENDGTENVIDESVRK